MGTKRLQVLLDDDEFAQVREDAARHGMTVSAWVRHALHRTRREDADRAIEDKLATIDRALRHEHPTGDVDELLDDIDRGQRLDDPDPTTGT